MSRLVTVVVQGPPGSGKSAIARKLQDVLSELGCAVAIDKGVDGVDAKDAFYEAVFERVVAEDLQIVIKTEQVPALGVLREVG